jgi:hypothetical protein
MGGNLVEPGTTTWRVPVVVRLAAVIALAVALAVIGWEPAAAAATNSGACSYSLNGSSSKLYSTPDSALHVTKDQKLSVSGTSPSRFRRYEVDLQYAMFTFKVAEGEPDGNTFSREVNIADYAKYGAGTYKVVSNANTDGGACAADGYIFVAESPLETIGGIVAAGATAVGAAGVLAGAGAAGTEGGGTTDEWERQHQTDRPALAEDPNAGDDPGDGEEQTVLQNLMSLGCFGALIPLGLLGVVVVVGISWVFSVLGAA